MVSTPDHLDATGRDVWAAAQAQLSADGVWQDCDAWLLEAFATAVASMRRGEIEAAGTPWVSGSAGQLAAHPGLRLAASLRPQVAALADRLLLSPAARRRAGVGDGPTDGTLDRLIADAR